jgi:hypothetical protein
MGGAPGVEQQRRTGRGAAKHVGFVEEAGVVAAYEVGLGHQIRRLDRLGPEPQM